MISQARLIEIDESVIFVDYTGDITFAHLPEQPFDFSPTFGRVFSETVETVGKAGRVRFS